MPERAMSGADGPQSAGDPRQAARLRELKGPILERLEARVRSQVPVLVDVDTRALRLGPAEMLDQLGGSPSLPRDRCGDW